MATEVAKLVARLEADVRDFEKGMKRAEKRLEAVEKEMGDVRREGDKQQGTFSNMTKGVKGFAAAAGVAFAAKTVFDFGKAAVNAASDLQESINAVNVTFGEAAEGILKIGEGAADALGLSNAEFNSLAVSFSAFTEKIAGAEGRSVVDVMDDLTQRAADFASVMNLDVAEAATLFRSGLAGETEAVRRFGIDLSSAAVNAKAMALGLAESSSALTEQDKILARYQLLMEQTAKTQGDFANTSTSFANGMRRLEAAFEDAKAEIGEQLLPVLERLIPVAIDVVKWIGSMALEFGNLIGVVSDAELAIEKARLGLDENADAGDHFVASLDRLEKHLMIARDGGDDFAESQRRMTDAIEAVIADTKDLRQTFGFTGRDILELRDGSHELIDALGLTEEQVQMLVDALEEQSIRAEGNEDDFMKLASATGQAMNAFFGASEGAEELNDEFEKGSVEEYIDSIGGLSNEMGVLTAATQRALDKLVDFDNFIMGLTDPVFGATNALHDYEEATKELAKIQDKTSPKAIAAFEKQTGALARMASSLKKLGPNWREEFRLLGESMEAPVELIEEIIDHVEDAQDIKGDIAFGFVPFWADSLPPPPIDGVAGGNIPVAPPPLPRVPGLLDTGFLQHGGPVTAGEPVIVGEAGRELFVPSTPGMVLPHSRTETALNGGTAFNVDANITLEVTETVADADLLARDTVRALRDELERLEREVV